LNHFATLQQYLTDAGVSFVKPALDSYIYNTRS